MNNPSSKTPIAYYGGKISLLSHILPRIPPHEVYTETFFGGGAVFFSKEPVKNETINDTLDMGITFYRAIKTDFKALKNQIDATLLSRTMHREATDIWRHPEGHDNIKKAWAFWMITNFSHSNKMGGGIKYSNFQTTCVPEQMKNKKANFTDWLVDRLEHAHIENNDALIVLESRNVSKAFHYIDPPYFNADMGHYAGYTEQNTVDLLKWCETCKGRFLLSSYNSELLTRFIDANGWYKQEITHRLSAPRKTGTAKVEVLVSNYSETCLIENRLFK